MDAGNEAVVPNGSQGTVLACTGRWVQDTSEMNKNYQGMQMKKRPGVG